MGLENPVPALSNLKMHLVASDGEQIPGTLYGKVVGAVPGSTACFSIRFTSVSPDIETFLGGLTAGAAVPSDATDRAKSSAAS